MAARRGLDFWAGMLLGLALLAGWLAMLALNTMPYLQGATPPPAPLAMLTHIVTPPGLELEPDQAALVGWALAALVVGLAVALIAGALRVGGRGPHPAFGHLPLREEGSAQADLAGGAGALVKEAGGAEHPPLPAPLTPESAPPPTFATPAAAPKVAPLISPPEATAAPETPLAAPTVAPVVTPVTPAPMTAPATRASTSAAFEPWVFISHSSRDEGFGQRLAASLRAALPPDEAGRARVWYDQAPERGQEDVTEGGEVLEPGGLTVGMDYPTEIAEQIAARTVIVVVLSPEAARSRWVKYELSLSVRRYNGSERVLICPLVYRACVTPNSIGIFQTLDFQGADGDAARYQKQVGELVARLRDGRWPLSDSAPPFEVGALPAPERLVGRDEHLEWVVSRLRAGGATAITALGGLGGIGKSALAAVAIRRLRAEGAFPDGIVVVGCELETDAVKILRVAIERFLPGQRTLDAETLPALASAALKELEGKRALIVLDNVEPELAVAEVCGPLKEAGVTLLLTARQTPPNTVVPPDGVRRLELLDAAHALVVFTLNYRGPNATPNDPSAEERAAAERIVTAVDRHTLAVRLAGSQAAGRVAGIPAAQRGAVLAAVAAGIEHDMLGIPDGDTSRKVEMVLRLSVDALPLDGQRLFTALAAFASGEFGRQAAIALARGLALANPEDAVDLLIRRALLDPSYDAPLASHAQADAVRLRLHPLLRALALKHLANWPQAERAAVYRGIAAWYSDYMPQVNNSSPIGYLALTPDEANITGALDWALDHKDDRAAARICNGMRDFWRDTGRTRAGFHYLPLGAAAAGRVADQTQERQDRLTQANITGYYGDILRITGNLTDAERIYTQNLAIRREVSDRQGEGVDLSNLGQIALRRGQLEAETFYQQALVIGREVSNRRGEGMALSYLGKLAEQRGDLAQAEACYREGLAILQEAQDAIQIAGISQQLGVFLLRHGRNQDEGRRKLDEAIALWRAMGLSDQEEQARDEARAVGYNPQ